MRLVLRGKGGVGLLAGGLLAVVYQLPEGARVAQRYVFCICPHAGAEEEILNGVCVQYALYHDGLFILNGEVDAVVLGAETVNFASVALYDAELGISCDVLQAVGIHLEAVEELQ